MSVDFAAGPSSGHPSQSVLKTERVIAPLAARQGAEKAAMARKIAASKVEFFTV
jgi:alpha-D-ribose 1-methylphosphonate 5-triphosphate synthase subunit PhnG